MGSVAASWWSRGNVPYIAFYSTSLASEHSSNNVPVSAEKLSVSQLEFVYFWDFTFEATTTSEDKSNSSVSTEGFTTKLYKLFLNKELSLPSH